VKSKYLLQYNEVKHVDPDSQPIGTAGNAVLPAAMQNGLTKVVT
jgi:hypothetical protein